MGEQLTLVGGEDAAALRIDAACKKAGLADSTLLRYSGLINSWCTYVALKNETIWDASTDTLLHWLDHQMRRHLTVNHMTMCLAAVRHAQRAFTPEGKECVPYVRDVRPRLDLFVGEMLKMATVNGKGPAQMRPLLAADLVKFLDYVRRNARRRNGITYEAAVQIARRDAAALLVGWWGALRSQELASLTWDDCREVPEGLEIWLANSKTGPATVALARQPDPYVCPVVALMEWKRHALTQPLAADKFAHFRTLTFQMTRFNMCKIMTRLSRDVGLSGRYSSHSLRAGFASEAARQGIDDRDVMRHARWTSRDTHDKYVRHAELWERTPTRLIKFSER